MVMNGWHIQSGAIGFGVSKTPAKEAGIYMEERFSFGRALLIMICGGAVSRTGWHGSGLKLWVQFSDEHSKMTRPYIYMEYPEDHETYPGARVPWLCSISDFLAEDYTVAAIPVSDPNDHTPTAIDFVIDMLKGGRSVTRPQWHGKGMYLSLVPGSGDKLPFVSLTLPDGKRVPWVPSQTDIFALDWTDFGFPPKTYGEYLVGLDFNPSGSAEVNGAKRGFADEISRMQLLKSSASNFEKVEFANAAIMLSVQAQMMAVKAITWKE